MKISKIENTNFCLFFSIFCSIKRIIINPNDPKEKYNSINKEWKNDPVQNLLVRWKMKHCHTQQRNSGDIQNVNYNASKDNKNHRVFELSRKSNYKRYEKYNHTQCITTFYNPRNVFIMVEYFYTWLFQMWH